MSFMYSRTIRISRPGSQLGSVGFNPAYAGDQKAKETEIACDIAANIQLASTGGKAPVGLPADGALNAWNVFTKRHALADGLIQNRDIITDDLKRRFQVIGDYGNSMGGKLYCIRLEA